VDLLFVVIVEDVNEEGPMFDKPSYFQILLDNSTAGTLVVDIDARDESKGYDEGIFYNITGMLRKMSWVFITRILAYYQTMNCFCGTKTLKSTTELHLEQ